MKRFLVTSICTVGAILMCACTTPAAEAESENASFEEKTTEDKNTGETSEVKVEGASESVVSSYTEEYITDTDEIKWEYNSSTKSLVLSGKGPMREYTTEEPEWMSYCDEAERIVIGDEITTVGGGAFMWFSRVNEVVLGEAVEYVGISAFADCYELRTVDFPNSLKVIDDGAFVNVLLHSENGFIFPEGLKYIGEEAFYSAFKESTVSIPASVEYIAEDALNNCFVEGFIVDENNAAYASVDGVLYTKDMKVLLNYPAEKQDTVYEIPATVERLTEESIQVTNTLEKIIIPASVNDIPEASIYWNYGLKSIEVATDNSAYISNNGVLYTKDGKTLLAYPNSSEANEYTVCEGTERIGKFAMSSAANLTCVHVPEGVVTIGDSAFYNSNFIEEMGLPTTLESIDNSAFKWCDALTRINYASSSDDWAGISVGDNNELLSNGQVTVYPAK